MSIVYQTIDIKFAVPYHLGMPTLKQLREKQYISQEDLAKKTGVSPSTINRLENGLQKPRWVTIRKLAEALGVEPGDIEF